MRRTTKLCHKFVDTLPAPLAPATLYISGTHDIAAHLCCCGCGEEIITPLSTAGWSLRYNGSVTLHPSIGNGALSCRSHYVIRESEVEWLPNMTLSQHNRARTRDKAAAQQRSRKRGLRDRIRTMFAKI